MTREHAYKIREMLHKASASLADDDALEAIELFPVWQPDTDYAVDVRVRYGDKLYRVRQDHTSQEQYPPSINTASLYEEVVADQEAGTIDNPIEYNGNMKLFNGKYYTQYGVLYLCTRDTGNPVYNDLSALVGLYVEIVRRSDL